MAFDQETGTVEIRKEVIDKVLKTLAPPKYKFKQAVTISTTNAWKNTFFRGENTVLTDRVGNATKGIPRGAAFPQLTTTFEEVNAWVEKYGAEDTIFYEDILTNDVDVMKRTIFKLTEKVISAVDDEIWQVLTEKEAGSPANIQTVTVSGDEWWNGSSAAIIDDLMACKQAIGEQNYDSSNLICFINEQDHRSIVNYLAEKGAQFPTVGTDMAKNGRIGKLVGINLVVSNNVTSSMALVVVPKVCGTWKSAVSLRSDTKVEAFKGTRVRIVEMGVTQLTDPKAVVRIAGTYMTP